MDETGIFPAMDIFMGGKATGSRWMGATAHFSQVCDLENMGCSFYLSSAIWACTVRPGLHALLHFKILGKRHSSIASWFCPKGAEFCLLLCRMQCLQQCTACRKAKPTVPVIGDGIKWRFWTSKHSHEGWWDFSLDQDFPNISIQRNHWLMPI